ncbi:MAG: hypothetical protein WKG01_42220, partial [Kofleriaceae bacterium]
SAAMYAEGDALDYYLNPTRGKVPTWSDRFAVMAWSEWLESDFVSLAPAFDLPLSIVTGDATATPTAVKDFIHRLPHKPTVHQHAGTQFDFYDNPDTVQFASEHAIAHFNATLKVPA